MSNWSLLKSVGIAYKASLKIVGEGRIVALASALKSVVKKMKTTAT